VKKSSPGQSFNRQLPELCSHQKGEYSNWLWSIAIHEKLVVIFKSGVQNLRAVYRVMT